ncbi:hypothetical protein Tco_1405704 [Tanacetum coccineum]
MSTTIANKETCLDSLSHKDDASSEHVLMVQLHNETNAQKQHLAFSPAAQGIHLPGLESTATPWNDSTLRKTIIKSKYEVEQYQHEPKTLMVRIRICVEPLMLSRSLSNNRREGCAEINLGGDVETLDDEGSHLGEKKRRLNLEQVKALEKIFKLGNKEHDCILYEFFDSNIE